MKWVVTRHALVRYVERVIFKDKANEAKVQDYLSKNQVEVKAKILELLSTAKEEKRYLNDTGWRVHLGEKYGYDRVFKFFNKDRVTFLAEPFEGGCAIYTIILDFREGARLRRSRCA